jgi:two-component system, cell cycle response regulator DivK
LTDPTGDQTSRVSVLLVEAAQDDRDMYAEYLRRHEFDAIETDDPRQALALALSVDVIVTASRIGHSDCIELVRRLRADERTHEKAIVILTGYAATTEEKRALEAGCDAFLLKPCAPETLVAEIRRLLGSRAAR